MAWETRCIVDNACELGEGPIWDSDRQRLLWVDIFGKAVHALNPESGKQEHWQLDEMVGFVLPSEDGPLIAGLASGLATIDLDVDLAEGNDHEQCLSPKYLVYLDEDQPEVRLNDGVCDSQGRLWCGTMHMPATQTLGKLYCFDGCTTPTVADDGYLVTNGPALSNDGQTLYHTESVASENQPAGIYAFDLHDDGSLHNKRLHIPYLERQATPDGLMVDADDQLWVGEWGGSKLACFDSQGKLLLEIPLPTSNVTKAAFGGKNLDVLYVTTATAGLSAEQLAAEPQAGGLFEIYGVGQGLEPRRFRGLP